MRRRKRSQRRLGFFVEDEVFEPMAVPTIGSLFSDWGPLEQPRKRFWQKVEPEPEKPTFGFSRALED